MRLGVVKKRGSGSSLRWFDLPSAPCCRGSSFEMRLQGTWSFPRRTPNVLVGLIWLPAGFYKFSHFFDSCLTFPAPKHRQWNMETLKHFGQLKRHKETILRIWGETNKEWRRGWETHSQTETLTCEDQNKFKKIYSRHANIADWQQRHWWKEQKVTEETPQEASNLMIGTFVGCGWGLSNTAGTVSFIKDIFEREVFIYVFKPKGWRTWEGSPLGRL